MFCLFLAKRHQRKTHPHTLLCVYTAFKLRVQSAVLSTTCRLRNVALHCGMSIRLSKTSITLALVSGVQRPSSSALLGSQQVCSRLSASGLKRAVSSDRPMSTSKRTAAQQIEHIACDQELRLLLLQEVAAITALMQNKCDTVFGACVCSPGARGLVNGLLTRCLVR